MRIYLGLDIGSINVKLSLIDESGHNLYVDVERIGSNTRITVNLLLNRLNQSYKLEEITSIGLSGSGKTTIPKEYHWAEYSSSLSIATGLLHSYYDAKTIIKIGGHSSMVVGLKNGLKEPWEVAANTLCGAGTGLFLEQQAHRLGLNLDEFTKLALSHDGEPPRVAARCSVFAKSDLIHLQQKGVPIESICYALCESIARMVISERKGVYEEPVYFVGGVAANAAIIKAIENLLSTKNNHSVRVIVPENYLFIESLGAGLLSIGKQSGIIILPETKAHQTYFEMPGLVEFPAPAKNTNQTISTACDGYLGIDVGSTSTKAVIIDEAGKELIAKNYLMTAGRPVEALKQVFRNLQNDGADRVNILAVGVTGSGRYLIGSLVGADLIKNEITAQTRAAADIDPEADIIEIGGQDSKLVIKKNGMVIDYQMNKACAAGTGSFIDEMAETLGVSVRNGEFAKLAFTGKHTIDLGTKCAAFMSQAVTSAQQEGIPLEIITASLSNSIAKNYLSKVVGTRKLGRKIILTGAVFYNEAVVSAFNQELKDKTLIVAPHREISGAIGAALLAKESMINKTTKFKGFGVVVENVCNLAVFNCEGCDNNCSITEMKIPNEKPTFYGSRCDRYDSTTNHNKVVTAFDDREKLLLREYHEVSGSQSLAVGIPRALVIYDYAPLFISFLNKLGTSVVISNQTNKRTIEHALELSYADSCFPIKLLQGHVDSLKNADYILYPSAIRMGIKEGEENQKYACPLVQASPYIIRHVLNLEEKMLIPKIDFSRGNQEVIASLTHIAVRMGFSRQKGKEAALAGLTSQRDFENEKLKIGEKLLKQVHDKDRLGVVLLTRSYMSQDSGANLGVAQKLAQLGVVPIPLDFLPLHSIDIKKYSDRPYWSYEGKFIAAAAIIAADKQLYCLALTNFGCGPNSFILKIVEDIMSGKPLGQLEIDEHAAEAGIVTRLEAFADTIKAHYYSASPSSVRSRKIYRGIVNFPNDNKTILVPRMSPNAEAIAAALQAFNVSAMVLPEPNESNLLYANGVTSGTECLPFRITLGDFMRFYHENKPNIREVKGFMVGSFGPCRLGKYAVEQINILKEIGFELPLIVSVSNNAYGDLKLGSSFNRLVWRGIVAIDYLQKMLLHTRPYEKQKGLADQLFGKYLVITADQIRLKRDLNQMLRQASSEFVSLIDARTSQKPLIGINGEAYLRANQFSNKDLIRVCEQAGMEVVLSPVTEWINYTSFRKLEDSISNRKAFGIMKSFISKSIQEHDETSIANCFGDRLTKEASTSKLLEKSGRYLSPSCGSEAVLSLGSGIEWMESDKFAGVISVMPHGCMPGGIIAAMAEKFSVVYHKPWISLTYDGFQESNNLARITEFAEIVRFYNNKNKLPT
jgi:predicted CoA-substrate-specific enzyme activase